MLAVILPSSNKLLWLQVTLADDKHTCTCLDYR